MKLWLIRHTNVNVAPGICYGQTDVDVAETFENEAQVIKKQIENIAFDKVYSSPLIRCKKLAEYLFKTNIIYDARLRELHFGEWEMQAWDKIQHPELNKWMIDFVNTPCPGGESFIDLHNRVKHFLTDLKKKNHSQVVIISHGGTIRSILSHTQNIPLKDSFKISVKHGDVTKIDL